MRISRVARIVFFGLASTLGSFGLAQAQDSKKSDEASSSSKSPGVEKKGPEVEKKDAASAEVLQKIDQLLGQYNHSREQALEANENTLKDIDRMIKEVSSLQSQRHQMMVLAATLKAHAAVASHPDSGELASKESLQRELQVAHSQLRQELEQTRAQLGQSAAQLEAYRNQLTQSKAAAASGKDVKPAKTGVAPRAVAPVADPG